jgi:Mg-chelatase subunit ChlD
LAACADPFLFGVRHHSSACAAAVGPWLDQVRPTRVLLELPPEFASWLPWLGHEGARAPLALGAVLGREVSFYPFADFSPELQVVRWCLRNGVPCEPFDLPMALRRQEQGPSPDEGPPGPPIAAALNAAADAPDGEAAWDRLVEGPSAGQDPEAVRRAALLYGWALRADTSRPARRSDLAREAWMRRCLARARAPGARLAAVVGSFHGGGLLPDPGDDPLPRLPEPPSGGSGSDDPPADGVVTSLVAYGFEQLDSRSGYPAGIRDPQWHQRVLERTLAHGTSDEVAQEVVVEICRELRQQRQLAGTPDAAEALRMARGLCALRGLHAPGRRELLEGLQSALARGEVLGRGRVVARAIERVLVGEARGRLAPGTPRSGLLPHVEALLAALRLPGPDDEAQRDPVRLDPLRSELDRRRHVALRRLVAAHVEYGDLRETDGVVGSALTAAWMVAWTSATEATLTAAGLRGVTLEQAAAGALRAAIGELQREDRLAAAMWLDILETAAEAGLHAEVHHAFDAVRTVVVTECGLVDLVRAVSLVERIAAGHVPGCPVDPQRRVAGDEPGAIALLDVVALRCDGLRDELLAACVRAVDGLAGATDLPSALALAQLVRVFERSPDRLGDGRLLHALRQLADTASPLIRGSAGAALAALSDVRAPESRAWEGFGERVGSWVDACADAAARAELGPRLQGAVAVAAPQFEAHPGLLGPLLSRVAALDDDGFLVRLPALRDGFDVLSPAGRERLFAVVREQTGDPDASLELDAEPAQLLAWATADSRAMAALAALPSLLPPEVTREGPLPAPASAPPPSPTTPTSPTTPASPTTSPGARIQATDRWRLVLGTGRRKLTGDSRRVARALDELYGNKGRGEGSRGELAPGSGGGHDEPYPTVRDWSEDLSELFGGSVREEVLGKAAARGDVNALLELRPDEVTPSIALLEQVLSLKGGLSEAHLEHLRRIVDRVVRALVEALAVRVRPALTGLSLPRPTRRPTRRLDLPRTVRANLATARRVGDGDDARTELVPDKFVFRTRGRRSMDWRVVLVVDTSGSMDANVVHSAMMAAILSSLPAVDVRFLAFSTTVLDLSERADDPLGLLMEVRVGGGTHIGKALRFARNLVTVPTRTLLCVVSDFEEGGPVPGLVAEVRALAESGVKLLGLAALDDRARPNYNVAIAERLVAAGMPVAALTPVELARWVAEQIR